MTRDVEISTVGLERQAELLRALSESESAGWIIVPDDWPFHAGFICKRCGGPSPVGIGYVDCTEGAAERSAGLTQCGCGWSVADPLWSAREVAEYLGIGVSTWRAYLSRGRAPQADDRDEDRPAGSRIPRWRMSTVIAFKAAQKRGR